MGARARCAGGEQRIGWTCSAGAGEQSRGRAHVNTGGRSMNGYSERGGAGRGCKHVTSRSPW